ncbi:MAG: helix-turn-helix transcriptional regulator [Muribaculum sp.]|nr:helix-turn-helix transcriptional regulator [Muribaculum sp.]
MVLAEKKVKSKWLAEQIGKDPATVSKWCTNTSQPSLECLWQIAELLEVDIKDLLNSNRIEQPELVYLKLAPQSVK